jgi:hypothetical protein
MRPCSSPNFRDGLGKNREGRVRERPSGNDVGVNAGDGTHQSDLRPVRIFGGEGVGQRRRHRARSGIYFSQNGYGGRFPIPNRKREVQTKKKKEKTKKYLPVGAQFSVREGERRGKIKATRPLGPSGLFAGLSPAPHGERAVRQALGQSHSQLSNRIRAGHEGTFVQRHSSQPRECDPPTFRNVMSCRYGCSHLNCTFGNELG